MALPKSYLTSTKNLSAILDSIRQAKAPERFTQRFLESLDFKASSDRLIIGVLKSIGFLDDQGRPTPRYFSYLDQTQSAQMLAEGVREAFADLFQVNVNAHTLSKSELINKFKTLSQGTLTESVLDKMALTFLSLVKLADFSAPARVVQSSSQENHEDHIEDVPVGQFTQLSDAGRNPPRQIAKAPSLGGLHYNIQIILPESRDPKVYDALFRSLREHLL